MTGPERDAIAHLDARLFGLDSSGDGGAMGRIEERLAKVEDRIAKWDGAIAFVRAGGTILGFGGIAAVIAALSNAAPK